MATIFDQLDREWPALVRSPEAGAALARWATTEPVLARFPTLAEVASFARRGEHHAVDRMFLALVRCAAGDPAAAAVVLHLLLPGCRALARRLAWVDRDRRELAAATVAAVYGRARCYPVERRPRLVALNILLDAAKDVRQGKAEPATLRDDFDTHTGESRGASPSDELAELLREAVRDGLLDVHQARLVAAVRLFDIRVGDIAEAAGCHPGSIRRHRHAAEQKLAGRAA